MLLKPKIHLGKNDNKIGYIILLPATPTGQEGAFVGASNRCRINGSAFIMVIENPAKERLNIMKFYQLDLYLKNKTKL